MSYHLILPFFPDELRALLLDPSISDLMINGTTGVYADRAGVVAGALGDLRTYGATSETPARLARARPMAARAARKLASAALRVWLAGSICSSRALSWESAKSSHHLPRRVVSEGCAADAASGDRERREREAEECDVGAARCGLLHPHCAAPLVEGAPTSTGVPLTRESEGSRMTASCGVRPEVTSTE